MSKLKVLLVPLFFLLVSVGGTKLFYDATLMPEKAIPLTTELKKVVEKNQQSTSKTKSTAVSNVDLKDLAKAKNQYQKVVGENLVGQLKAPSVGLALPILKEANDTTLSLGASQNFPDRKMGVGNYVLASHNFHGSPILMYKIKDLKKGDQVTISDFKKEFVYEVVENRVIHQSQVDLVAETKEPTLTLFRCEGPIHTEYRQMVTAKLVENKPAPKNTTIETLDGSTKKTTSLTFYEKILQQISSSQWFNPIRVLVGKAFNSQQTLNLTLTIWFMLLVGITLLSFIPKVHQKHGGKK